MHFISMIGGICISKSSGLKPSHRFLEELKHAGLYVRKEKQSHASKNKSRAVSSLSITNNK